MLEHPVLQELPSPLKIKDYEFTACLFPAIDLCCITLQFFSPYLNLIPFFLFLKVEEEKGAFDFIVEVTAAIPKLSTWCLPLFLMVKSEWSTGCNGHHVLLKWCYNLVTFFLFLLETAVPGLGREWLKCILFDCYVLIFRKSPNSPVP